MEETSHIAPRKGRPDPGEGYVNEGLDVDQVDITTVSEPQTDVKRVTIVKATDIFCPGARFDGIAKPVIAPPPPGVAPNIHQQMYGHSNTEFVILDQKKKS